MKKYLFFATCIALFCLVGLISCDKNPIQAYETVSGKVTDEEGQALKGIEIAKYLDKDLKDLVDRTRTTEDGSYYLNENSLYVEENDTVLIYLQASDPAGKFQTQVVSAQMIYNPSSRIGQAKADIVMHK